VKTEEKKCRITRTVLPSDRTVVVLGDTYISNESIAVGQTSLTVIDGEMGVYFRHPADDFVSGAGVLPRELAVQTPAGPFVSTRSGYVSVVHSRCRNKTGNSIMDLL